MAGTENNESIQEIFFYETSQYLESLEQFILNCEKSSSYSQEMINEVFRIMHNIKSSSAMMLLDNISTLAHKTEDLFFFLREQKPREVDYLTLSDLILESIDFIKVELEKFKNGDIADGDSTSLKVSIGKFLEKLKQSNSISVSGKQQATGAVTTTKTKTKTAAKTTSKKTTAETVTNAVAATDTATDTTTGTPTDTVTETRTESTILDAKTNSLNSFQAVLYFQEGCEMENVRAYVAVHTLQEVVSDLAYEPADIIENDSSAKVIREEGFKLTFKTERTYREILDYLNQTAYIRDLKLEQTGGGELNNQKQSANDHAAVLQPQEKGNTAPNERETLPTGGQSMISVNVAKLDALMDLVGEMVIAEAMVIQNPDLKGLNLDNFKKAARQLEKITGEVQDVVMSIRMVPLTTTFLKMNRVVRDMKKKLGKAVELQLVGQETEVDKNIIEHIADPLMHLVRNAIDHGIETEEERKRQGKTEPAKVVIEAKNAGSDVLIIVRDNGRGLDQAKILQRAKENNLLDKPESELSDKEIYNLIFLPGFSTKEKVSEFSGRGVGMDVVTKNIETIGGTVLIESVPQEGSSVILKIPLTLAIINGMNIAVGKSRYIIPITAIKESFKPKTEEIITDPDGNEMVMVRGKCYPILRLHALFNVHTATGSFVEGIFVMIENEGKIGCLFADELLGEHQVVVKALPAFIGNGKKIKGVAGCTLLGDGSISLILDIASLINNE